MSPTDAVAKARAETDAILARLLTLHPKEIDLSLDRLNDLLTDLGHPERDLPPVIHVAGTNGKGSTLTFMRYMLEAAGKRVHTYTSPHLVRFNERIRLGGEDGGTFVTPEALNAALAQCEKVNAGRPITFFEITTAAAFLLFSTHEADILLLEVGLGGRLDATNVILPPKASVITPVSLDHGKFLGEDVAVIAGEKAGIIKQQVPVVVSRQLFDAAEQRILAKAETMQAPLHLSGQEWMAFEQHGRFVYQDEQGLMDLPLPRLVGRHQLENAGAAITALRAAGFDLGEEAFAAGITAARWPARMQRLTEGRLVARIPNAAEVWLDGGHNPDGGRAVAAAIAELEDTTSRPLVMIVGMLSVKDPLGYFEHFRDLAAEIIAIPIEEQAMGLDPELLAASAREAGLPAKAMASVREALDYVAGEAYEAAPRVLLCGSLYLAGEILRDNETEPE